METPSLIKYKIEDKPPIGLAIVLGMQHVLTAFSGIVAVPLVVAAAVGLSDIESTYIISASIFMAGVATIIQAVGIGPIGGRMPMIMGTDFSFVGAGIAVASTLGLPGYFGATIAGSFVEIFASRILKKIMWIFPPLVTGIVITSIGLTMMPIAVDWIGASTVGYAPLSNLILAGIVMLVIVILNQFATGFFSSASIMIGIIVGYIVAYFMGILDFTTVAEANNLVLPMPFRHGVTFNLSAFIAFIPPYIVTTIETVGGGIMTLRACEEPIDDKRVAGSVLGNGVGSLLAGIFGAGPNTSFSQNIGLIPMTGMASRHVAAVAGIILVILGVFPKLGALINIMPSPVLGGAGIIMFGMIAAGGLKNLQDVVYNKRNNMIVAISLGAGLGVVFRPDILANLPETLQMIFGSGMTTATILAVTLNLVLPGREEVDSTEETLEEASVTV